MQLGLGGGATRGWLRALSMPRTACSCVTRRAKPRLGHPSLRFAALLFTYVMFHILFPRNVGTVLIVTACDDQSRRCVGGIDHDGVKCEGASFGFIAEDNRSAYQRANSKFVVIRRVASQQVSIEREDFFYGVFRRHGRLQHE